MKEKQISIRKLILNFIVGLSILLGLILSTDNVKKNNNEQVNFQKKISLTSGEHKLNLNVKKNDIFEVVLEGNPTTGYSWLLNTDKTPFEIVKPINLHKLSGDNILTGQYESLSTKDKNGYQIMGSGGNYSFKFSVVDSGNQSIEIDYARIWEKNEPFSKVIINITSE